MTETADEYNPRHWVRIKHSRTQQAADGESVTLFWSVESHDDLRAVSSLRHAIVQTYAAHTYKAGDAAGEEQAEPTESDGS